MVRGASTRRELADGLVHYAMGRIPYRTARRRLIRRLPGVAVTLAMQHFTGKISVAGDWAGAARSQY
jgi:hypothetical protein